MLTDRRVKALGVGKHYDAGGTGLLLRVTKDDRRAWVQRLTIAGKQRELGHGVYPKVSLAAARLAAAQAKDVALAGGDPIAERKGAQKVRLAAAVARLRTLGDAATAYLEAHGAGWKPGARREFRSRLARHAALLMDKPVADLTVDDVRATLAPLWITKTPTATTLRSNLRHVIDYARAAGWRDSANPAMWDGTLRPLLARPSAVHTGGHHAALPWPKVPSFVAALRKREGKPARVLELSILCASRSGEVRGMVWGEVDLPAQLWIIPKQRMKAGREHRVPLSPAAAKIIEAARPVLPDGQVIDQTALVFPSAAGTPLSAARVLKVLDTMHAVIEGGWRDHRSDKITPHGFRSSFRDWAGDHGHSRDVAEAALAHQLGSEIERAYARSDLLQRRRALMDSWGMFCNLG